MEISVEFEHNQSGSPVGAGVKCQTNLKKISMEIRFLLNFLQLCCTQVKHLEIKVQIVAY